MTFQTIGFAVIEISNDKEIIMFRRDGTLYAMDRFCPHQGAPLDRLSGI
jgi:nitrite reductase/ring-hydroxylating ferredoxin subunit